MVISTLYRAFSILPSFNHTYFHRKKKLSHVFSFLASVGWNTNEPFQFFLKEKLELLEAICKWIVLINSPLFLFRPVCRYLQLKLNDRKSRNETEHVSLVLKLSETSLEPNIVVEASFRFLIYDQAYGKHIERECKIANIYGKTGPCNFGLRFSRWQDG